MHPQIAQVSGTADQMYNSGERCSANQTPVASTEGLNNHVVIGKSQVSGQMGVAR